MSGADEEGREWNCEWVNERVASAVFLNVSGWYDGYIRRSGGGNGADEEGRGRGFVVLFVVWTVLYYSTYTSVNCNDVTVCNFVICVVHSISSCLLLAQLCYVPVKCVMCYVIALIACLTCSLPM